MRSRAGWGVSTGRGYIGRFPSRSEAIQTAVKLASVFGKQGDEAAAVAVTEDYDVYSLWTYGIDGLVLDDDAVPIRQRLDHGFPPTAEGSG
jgi:hypothetical protein